MAALLQILEEDVIEGARRLLGAELRFNGLAALIVETEAYRAEDDPACHAYRKRTARNDVMFQQAGLAYVYFNYGVHWMLNVTAHDEGLAAAVLVRAAVPVEGLEEMRERRRVPKDRDLLNGPGKLCQAFGVGPAQNGTNLFGGEDLEIREAPPRTNIVATPRIGIARGKGHELLWRFVDEDRAEWASKFRPVK